MSRVKISEKKFNSWKFQSNQWNHYYRKEEDTVRDAHGFVVIENPQEFRKITDLFKHIPTASKELEEKPDMKSKRSNLKSKAVVAKEMNNSQKTTTNSGGQSNNPSKIKFFQTFDQMTQHMKEKTNKKKESVSEVSCRVKKKTTRKKTKKISQESEKRRLSQSRKRKTEKSGLSMRRSNEEQEKSSVSVSESRKKQTRKSGRRRKESINHKNLLKQNLEDHHLKKINFLTEQLEQQNKFFKDYSQRVKNVLRTQILQNEEHEKQKKRRYLRMAKERLGEYVLRGGMAKTKEVWVDGGIMKDVKEELKRVREEKELREKFRKTLKKRKTGTITAEEINYGELKNPKDSKSKHFQLIKRKPDSTTIGQYELPRKVNGSRFNDELEPNFQSFNGPANQYDGIFRRSFADMLTNQ